MFKATEQGDRLSRSTLNGSHSGQHFLLKIKLLFGQLSHQRKILMWLVFFSPAYLEASCDDVATRRQENVNRKGKDTFHFGDFCGIKKALVEMGFQNKIYSSRA